MKSARTLQKWLNFSTITVVRYITAAVSARSHIPADTVPAPCIPASPYKNYPVQNYSSFYPKTLDFYNNLCYY